MPVFIHNPTTLPTLPYYERQAASDVPRTVKERLWKAAQNFEAMTIGQMLQPIFATLHLSQSPFGGGESMKILEPIFVSSLAKEIEKSGGFGLAKPVYESLLQDEEHTLPGNLLHKQA